jgi:hypothetical protein
MLMGAIIPLTEISFVYMDAVYISFQKLQPIYLHVDLLEAEGCECIQLDKKQVSQLSQILVYQKGD